LGGVYLKKKTAGRSVRPAVVTGLLVSPSAARIPATVCDLRSYITSFQGARLAFQPARCPGRRPVRSRALPAATRRGTSPRPSASGEGRGRGRCSRPRHSLSYPSFGKNPNELPEEKGAMRPGRAPRFFDRMSGNTAGRTRRTGGTPARHSNHGQGGPCHETVFARRAFCGERLGLAAHARRGEMSGWVRAATPGACWRCGPRRRRWRR
jgi:hypothetical protein